MASTHEHTEPDQLHTPTIDELEAENERLRDELHRCESQLTAIKAIVTGGGR